MSQTTGYRFTSPARSGAFWLLAAVVLVPLPLLTRPVSARIYEGVVSADIGAPSKMTQAVLLALIACFGLAAWGFRRLEITRILTAVLVGIGVVISYVLSEVLKLILRQERPCRAVVELDECPAVGDWSFPSNHTVIAFAVATGIVIITARAWAFLAYVAAAIVGILRVLSGAHYPHDVLAGAFLGVCVTVGISLLLVPLGSRFFARSQRGNGSNSPYHPNS